MNQVRDFPSPPQSCVDAQEDEQANAAITWLMVKGKQIVISRYKDDSWIWPASGSLSSYAEGNRRIDFEKVSKGWRPFVKRALFACLKHPRPGQRGLSFHSLRHRFYHLRRLTRLADDLGRLRLADLTKSQIESFLRNLTKDADHIETVVGNLITMSETHRMLRDGFVDDGLSFNVAGIRSSKKIAEILWKEVHGKNFDYETEGYQPHSDVDTEEMLGTAFFYVRKLAKPLIRAHREITEIWRHHGYGPGSYGGDKVRRVPPIVRELLTSLFPDENSHCEYRWPPRESKDVRSHLRILQGLCITLVAFFTLARRSEVLTLKANTCLTQNDEGEFVLHGRIFKGEDDLDGRPASWPVPPIVAEALTVLHDIRNALEFRLLSQTGRGLGHGYLLCSFATRSTDGDASSDSLAEDSLPMTPGSVGGLTRDLKRFVFPEIVGSCALHRLRKTAVRLVALTVEGSSLVLKNILHHDNSRTTIHYMFASPLMLQELASVWPEISASNLRELYGRRHELTGPGAANLLDATVRTASAVAAAQTEIDIDVTEDEFVSLGVDMMEKGHMLLTRLGVGIWCLKPALERGACNEGTNDFIPNGGRCSVRCRFHIQDSRRTVINIRDLDSINTALTSSALSGPVRAMYERYRQELLTVIPKELLPHAE